MKVPEAGTEVFHAEARTGTGAAASITGVGFSPDIFWSKRRTTTTQTLAWDRLRGQAEVLTPPSTAAASTAGSTVRFLSFDMGGYSLGTDSGYDQINANGQTQIDWLFKRAPKFMDIVAYTGNTAAQSLAHNLTITPELMIVKARSVDAWFVYYGVNTKYLVLNTTAGAGTAASVWNDTSPTASVFTVGTNESVGAVDYIAYLFATLAGVSKVGSYTGTAATLTIDCGFAAGARFILIKRTDSTGDWYVYDSARGIVAGNDPYLRLNSIAVEVTGTDYIDPESSGFQLTAAGSSTINVNTGEYIFLAIA